MICQYPTCSLNFIRLRWVIHAWERWEWVKLECYHSVFCSCILLGSIAFSTTPSKRIFICRLLANGFMFEMRKSQWLFDFGETAMALCRLLLQTNIVALSFVWSKITRCVWISDFYAYVIFTFYYKIRMIFHLKISCYRYYFLFEICWRTINYQGKSKHV